MSEVNITHKFDCCDADHEAYYNTEVAAENLFYLLRLDVDKETPERYVKAISEMVEGYWKPDIDLKVFKSENNEQGQVRFYDIEFVSLCKHHLLPFIGKASFVYRPKDGWVVGLSKVPKMIERMSKRLWLQEDLTVEIVKKFMSGFDNDKRPSYAAVSIEAIHTCMCGRGSKMHVPVKTFYEIGD